MILEAAGRTDIGRVRLQNQDAIAVLVEDGLFCVADGMGGHRGGEVASAIAIEEMTKSFAATRGLAPPVAPVDRLLKGLLAGDLRVRKMGCSDNEFFGMGTTIVALHVDGGRAYVAHAGDSRAYRFARDRLVALTEDHSLLNEELKAGRLKPEEAPYFRRKHVVVQALGGWDPVEPGTSSHRAQEGDLYLLCSDGLTGMLDDAELERRLVTHSGRSLESLADELIAAANEAGGSDNISVVLVRVLAI